MEDFPVSKSRGGRRGMSPRTRGISFTSHGGPGGSFRGRPGFRGRGGSSGRSCFPRRGRPRGGSSVGRGQSFRGFPQGRGAYNSNLPIKGSCGNGGEHGYSSDGVPAPKKSRWDTPNSGGEKITYRSSYTVESSIYGATSARGTGHQDDMSYGRFDNLVSASDIPSSSDDTLASFRNIDHYSSQEPNYNRFRSGTEPHELSQSTDPYSRPRNAAYSTTRNIDPYGTQNVDNPYSVSQGFDTYNRMLAEKDCGGGGSQTVLASYNSTSYSGGRTTPPDVHGGWGLNTPGSGYDQQYDLGASKAPSDDRYGYGNFRGASSYDKACGNYNDASAGYGPPRAGGGPFPPRRY